MLEGGDAWQQRELTNYQVARQVKRRAGGGGHQQRDKTDRQSEQRRLHAAIVC